MNIYSVLSFFAFLAYIGLGIFVLLHNKKAKLNWFFFLACVSLAIWSFCYSIHINADTKEMAILWRRFSAIGWAFMPVSITTFLYVLTNIKSKLLKSFIIPSFYFAALIFLIKALTGFLLFTDLYKIGDIWFVKDNHGSWWFYAWNVYFVFTYILSVYFIFHLYFKSNILNLKKASKIFLTLFLFLTVTGSLTDIIFPFFGVNYLPDIGQIICVLWISGIAWAVLKFKFMILNSKNASEEIIEGMNELVFYLDFNNKIIRSNRYTETLSGFNLNHLFDKHISEIFTEKELLNNHIDNLKNSDLNNFSIDASLITNNNECISVNLTYSLINDRQGYYYGAVIVGHDIRQTKLLREEINERKIIEEKLREAHDNLESRVNERTLELSSINETLQKEISIRTQVEKELRESEAKYQFIVENSDDILWTMNNQFKLDYVSPSVENILGYTVEEHLNHSLDDYLTPESVKNIVDEFSNGILNLKSKQFDKLRKTASLDVELIRKDKTKRFARITIVNIRDENYNILKIRGVTTDITERRLAKLALKKSEEKYKSLVENISDVIYTQDLEGDFTYVSPIIEQISSYKSEDLVGKPFLEFVYPEDIQGLLESYQLTLQGIDSPHDFRAIDKDGSIKHIRASSKLIYENNIPIIINGILTDISSKKIAEEKIKLALAEKEVLLREVHHRVKNNMQVILSLINMQAIDIKDMSMLSKYRELQERVRTMSMVHEDLYISDDLSKIDFSNYLKKLTKNLFRVYGHKDDIRYEFKLAEDVFLTLDTAIPCGLIVNELLSNSLKYGFPLGSFEEKNEKIVSLEIFIKDDVYILKVSDNGVGLHDTFDLATTRTMGLRLVNILVKDQIHGTIVYFNNPGANFEITFPKKS
jgi:PAS domain S-box-containing protein